MGAYAAVQEIALEAGAILWAGWMAGDLDVTFKGEINPVTRIDRECETYVLDALRRAFPACGVLCEESGLSAGSKDPLFIVDPLDGTTNYISGLPWVAVSLGVQVRDELVFGAVYNPILNEMFVGEKGAGATCNGEAIHGSGREELSSAVLVSGFPYDAWDNDDDNAVEWHRFLKKCSSLRCYGSAALELCGVACGRLDGYWEKGLFPWDVAGGTVIAREAGCLVTDYHGGTDVLQGRIVCARERIHAQMLEVLSLGDDGSSQAYRNQRSPS